MKPRNEPLIGAYEPEGKYKVDDLDRISQYLHDIESKDWPRSWSFKQEDNRIYDVLGIFRRLGLTVRIRKEYDLGQTKKDEGLREKIILTVKGKDIGTTVKNCPEYIDREIPRYVGKLIGMVMTETSERAYKKIRQKCKGQDGIEICLDRPYIDDHGKSEELGQFVEIEAKGKGEKGEMIIADWKRLLDIESDSIRESYAEMARKKRGYMSGENLNKNLEGRGRS